MSVKISTLLPVYNEIEFIRQSMKWIMEYTDEVVVIDGSPWGTSTDGTTAVIKEYEHRYPGKIYYLCGTFILPDGTWDESAQRNLGVQHVTGDYMLMHCGDMIYGEEDIARLTEAIRKHPERKIFYLTFIEFWIDQKHIRLYPGKAYEDWFRVPACGDIAALSMDTHPVYKDGPHLHMDTEYIYVLDGYMLFVSHAYRYHYGWISGFRKQIEKHVRNIKMGAWGEPMEHVRQSGDRNIVLWAIRHVLGYPMEPCGYPYVGKIPDVMEGTEYTFMDGYTEAIEHYNNLYPGLKDEITKFEQSQPLACVDVSGVMT